MALELRTISFNHDVTQATTSALNIRRNKDFEVLVPEYDRSQPRPATEQCAAYAIDATRNQPVFVRCAFSRAGADSAAWEVRANGGGVLGALDPQGVAFAGGAGVATIDMPLAHRSFVSVGRHTVTWQWECRVQGALSWQPLVSTAHCIYLVLSTPPAPWTQTFADRHNPWTDLLDHSCVIAAGTKNEMNAAIAHVKAINGHYALRYDILQGRHRYGYRNTGNAFDLTNWIAYVLNGAPPGSPIFCPGTGESFLDYHIVNCYDCAASLALMGKSVGTRLDYYFHGPFGYLNIVVPIGRGRCNHPFYGCVANDPVKPPDDTLRSRFGNHAYTKLVGQTNFDACMKQWLSWLAQFFLKLLMFLVWLIILILTFGLVNRTDLLERAHGWLVNLSQTDYDKATIDTSTPAEAAVATGSPAAQVLEFRVT